VMRLAAERHTLRARHGRRRELPMPGS
jgi:hypothetical protein